jgi:hypothetical protein
MMNGEWKMGEKRVSSVTAQTYLGFEQGPIRPPSEADSLLIRVTRNCPWNRCSFCPVYKGSRFSIRSVEDVCRDIDAVHRHVIRLGPHPQVAGRITPARMREWVNDLNGEDVQAFHAAAHWTAAGMKAIFIQDANSLIIKPADMLRILEHLKHRFPWVERITSYARSHTVARISDADLFAMGTAGLNRIHIGLESGCDRVLAKVQKGATQALHIKAGRKVKAAGIQLSEYVMPGLGGRELSRDHAIETAEALNRIDPDFIRLRTLAIPETIPLFVQYQAGTFQKCSDVMMAEEILLFIEHLDGITSMVKSDHILNLFQEVQGRLPQDKASMTEVLKSFLSMAPAEQCLYQVGRRLGIFSYLSDLQVPTRREKVARVCRENGIGPDNVEDLLEALMKRFV